MEAPQGTLAILPSEIAKMPNLDWNDLQYVLALARARTAAKAASRLRVNESTVIRRIARAEQKLKARLFNRSKGEFSLTEMGDKVGFSECRH
jgi:DNA-binding transcriptional LysR family regulator